MAQRRDPASGLLGEPGLADQLDVAGRLQEDDEAPADDFVVVEQVFPDQPLVLPQVRVGGTGLAPAS